MKTTNSPLTKKSNLIVLITALSLIIAAGGYFFYKNEESSIRQQKYNELKVIADLKVSQIEHWVHDRYADAKIVTNSDFFTAGVQNWLKVTNNKKLKSSISERLKIVQSEYGYENIFLCTPDGSVKLSVADTKLEELDTSTKQKIIEAVEKREIVFTDFYLSHNENKIHYDIIAPIITNEGNAIGVLVFRRDPNLFLYPLIQSWPTPSPSSETAILRVENENVLFLNELRHRKNTALKLKIPLTRTDVPAVQAALGRTGLFEGIDYRGVEVLSDIRIIPATNWIMLSKVDKSEIYADLYLSAGVISGFTILLIVICAVGFILVYNQRQKTIYEELYKKEKELWQQQERFKVTMDSVGEGIITTDVNGKIQYLNTRAEELTGWKLREAKGRMLSEIYHVKNEETGQIENNILEKVLKHGILKELANHTILITKNRNEIPVMDTGAPIFNIDGSINGIVITFHDEAEKRSQQKLIKESEKRYRFLATQFEAILDHIPGLVFYKDTKNNIIRVNRYFANAHKTTKEALEYKNCGDLYPKEDAEKYYEDDLTVINSGVAKLNIEEPWITETGSRWINTSKIPFVDNAGNIIGVIGLSFDITERKRAEEVTKMAEKSVRESEQRLKEAQRIAHIGNWDLDLIQNHLDWSDEIYRIFEIDSTKFGASYEIFLNMIHPDDREMVSEAYASSIRNRTEYDIVHRLLMPDGRIKFVHERCETHYDGGGAPFRSAGTVQDITERKIAEEKILKANRVYAVISQINQMIVRTQSRDELFREACRIATEFGQFQMAWIGLADERTQLVNPVVHSGVEDGYLSMIKKITISDVPEGHGPTGTAIREGKHFVCDDIENDPRMATWKDEALKRGYCSSIALPIKLFGKVIGAFSLYARVSHFFDQEEIVLLDEVTNDISFALETIETEKRRHEAELALCKSEEQFRLISENVADMIAVLDLDGKRIYNNPAYKPIFGDPKLLEGTDSFQEIHPDDREKIKRIFKETVETGIGHQSEYRFVAKDGSIHFIESNGSVIRDEKGKVSNVVVVSRDITEKKSLEQQLLRSQRMESIGTLAGGIAHDLNNVLAPIMLALEILRKKHTDADSQRMLETMGTSAKRGSDIVKQVLAFGRGVEGEHSLLQPRHVINEIVKIAQETFQKNIQIRNDVPKDLWLINADPTQMHQVLLNTFVNARDAMPSGGTITISGENISIDENYAKMQIEAKAGNYVLISVTDTGTGIPHEILDRIFEPFFTTKEIGKGTGLGLSTVRSIIKSHGGFINVYSKKNKGTTFKFYLPAEIKYQAIEKDEKKSELPLGNGELILVVDDEASIREITKETLEASGYRVLTGNDGTEAIALYATHAQNIALVITDMMMPYMSGEATIRALRNMNPIVKIIAVSGLEQSVEFMQQKSVKFLLKPYTAEKLLMLVFEVIKK